MLVRPATGPNNGNPSEKDMQWKPYGRAFQPRMGFVKTPHPIIKTYGKEDRQAWIDKLFGYEEFRSGLAAWPTDSLPPQRVNTNSQEDLSTGSSRHTSYVALQDLSEQLHKDPCYDLVIRGWHTVIQWFNTVSTKRTVGPEVIAHIQVQAISRIDYTWIDLMVAALDALHNNEDVELDDVDEVFVVPKQDQDEDVLDDEEDAKDTEEEDDFNQDSEEEQDDYT